ncbi:phage major capsid protein [Rheinheimera sp. MM224]|uniref:phage major capsid protein n=1 Tax=Rheinheimera sp. MM224 TaxID=3019969 RepID=UPI0021F84449|nr:phage major capsid protein [Rheinheimera sp. MM224]CAI3795992.1 hypothetical protein JAMGFMIE_01456 [Rheinheimera sp. MM224]
MNTLKELAEKTDFVHSVITIKEISDEKREFFGIATTPATDRMNDIVDPMGGVYTLPVSLLWHHRRFEPVGIVLTAKATKNGIEIKGSIPMIEKPAALAARLEEAWQSIKHKLVRGLSIGFRPIEYSFLDNGGIHFHKWEWLELSLVTIAANAEATITSIKSLDQQQLAAIGQRTVVARLINPAGASAQKSLTIIPKSQEDQMKTIAEQIAEFEGTLQQKSVEMQTIMQKAGEQGVTLDAQESELFDNLEAECTAIKKHIDRLKVTQKNQVSTVKSVTEDPRGKAHEDNVGGLGRHFAQAKNTQKLEPGIAFARAAKCLALGHLEHRDAISIAKSLYDGQDSVISATQRLVTKAPVAAATTTDSTWAKPLVGSETDVFADFVEFLRPQTILGRFGQAGIPNLRRVPFRVALVGQTSGGDGYWVGEGKPKPLTKFDFSRTTLTPLKVANIAVATMETIRDSSPSADIIIRDQLAAALGERLDIDFIDPNKAAVADISPASVLNGVAGIPSSGNDADAVRADLKAIFSQFIAANNAPTSGVWIMSATTALALSLMVNALGQPEFPDIDMMTGGKLSKIPVIVSEYIPTTSDGSIVALVNASDIYLGDEGGIDLSMSSEASLQMNNAPDSPATASTVMVSLWQTNMVGFRAERAINWSRRRASAVAYLTGVNWGAGI